MYESGTFLSYLYDMGIVVAGFFLSLLLTVTIFLDSWRRERGRQRWAMVMVMATIMALPAPVARWVASAGGAVTALGYLGLVGAAVAIITSVAYVGARPRGREEIPAEEAAGAGVTGVASVSDEEREATARIPYPAEEGETAAEAEEMVALPPDTGEIAARPLAEPQALEPGETLTIEEKPALTAWLAVKAGPGSGQTLQLDRRDNSIGRGPDNYHALEDPAVSRQHALIQWREGKFMLYDLGSRSGTKVDGEMLAGRPLASGNTITIGQTELAFMQVETEKGPPGPAEAAAPGETVMLEEKPGMTAWLVVKSGPLAGKMLPLKAGDTTIGRSAENDLTLEDAAVSRRHALLRLHEGNFVLYDLGSRSGTTVDGEMLAGKPLASGSTITIGQTELTFMQVETEK